MSEQPVWQRKYAGRTGDIASDKIENRGRASEPGHRCPQLLCGTRRPWPCIQGYGAPAAVVIHLQMESLIVRWADPSAVAAAGAAGGAERYGKVERCGA